MNAQKHKDKTHFFFPDKVVSGTWCLVDRTEHLPSSLLFTTLFNANKSGSNHNNNNDDDGDNNKSKESVPGPY